MARLLEDFTLLEDQIFISPDPKESIVLCTRILKLFPGFSNKGNIKKPSKNSRDQFSFPPNITSRCDDWLEGLYFAREFEEVILFAEKNPDNLSTPYNIQNTVGVCFLHLGDYDSAIKHFQDATHMKKDFGVGYFNWALALYLQGKKEEAMKMYERASQIREFPKGTYEREVNMLKEDLKREENKVFEDLINKKIEGFEFFIEMDRTERTRDEDVE